MLLIKGLSNQDLEVIQRHLVPRSVTRNTVLYDGGRPASSMFFVEEGSIKLVNRQAADGRDDVVAGVVKPGSFCGEEALLGDETPYQFTAVANEQTTVQVLSRISFQRLMGDSMAAGTKILLAISKTYRESAITPTQMAKIVTFYAPKDGGGKTCLAINTALILARSGKRVAFLDADSQFGDAALYLSLNRSLNLARLVQLEENLLFNRIKLYIQKAFDIDVLLGPDQPQEAELVTRTCLNHILLEVAKHYDFLIVDAASHLDEQSLLLLDQADRLILVGTPELASLARLHRLFKVFQRLDYPSEKIVGVINRVRPDSKDYLGECRKLFSQTFPVRENLPIASQSQLNGVPWAAMAPEADLCKDLQELASYLMGNSATLVEKGGVFSRLKSLFV